MTDEIKRHADKIVADQLDSYLVDDAPKAKPKAWTEDSKGGRWSSDDGEWDAAAPKYSVRPTMKEWLDEAERNGARINRRSGRPSFADAELPDMPLFLKREQPKIVAKPVKIDEPDRVTLGEWADQVRVSGGKAELSSYMLIKVADLLMRELENAMECGHLIWKSERDCFEAKLMVEEIVKKRVLFQADKGELVPVVMG